MYAGIWLLSVLTFWVFLSNPLAILYCIVVYYLLLPGMSFFLSLLIGREKAFGIWMWAVPVVLGVMHGLQCTVTFGLTSGHLDFQYQYIAQMMVSAVPALLGLVIGLIWNHRKRA